MVTRVTAAAIALTLSAAGCYSVGEGVSPPTERFHYPVGLVIDQDAKHLFVANSDFDLQFNAGTLQSYDLGRLRAIVPRPCAQDSDCGSDRRCDTTSTFENGNSPSFWCVAREGPFAGEPCGPFGETSPGQRVTQPGRCGFIDTVGPQDGSDRILIDSVVIGAFATDVLLRRRPADVSSGLPTRLFIPVRGDATVHFADVDENGMLHCGQGGNEDRCNDAHRLGDNPELENTRDIRLPPEPFAIDATADGRVVVVTHQSDGGASLFINDWHQERPSFQFFVEGLPRRPVGLATLPDPAAAIARSVERQPGFLVSFRDAPEIHLLRFFDDGIFDVGGSSPARPFLVSVGRVSITQNSVGDDSRGIAIDARARQTAERACVEGVPLDASCLSQPECLRAAATDSVIGEALTGCLDRAARIPLGVYVANRAPASLLVGETRVTDSAVSSDDLPVFHSTVPLTFGPSRVVVGDIIRSDGEREPRVFVLAFDTRLVFIYDPIRRRIEATIETGRGPHSLAVDAEHGLAYLGHFTDSYVAVVSLDQRFPSSYASIISTVGRPSPPRASK